MVSHKHGNFIVNRKKATFREVVELINTIKKIVFKEMGIILEEEIVTMEAI